MYLYLFEYNIFPLQIILRPNLRPSLISQTLKHPSCYCFGPSHAPQISSDLSGPGQGFSEGVLWYLVLQQWQSILQHFRHVGYILAVICRWS